MKTINWLGRHEIHIPEYIQSVANWDVYAYWEKCRWDSIEANLHIGDKVLDIGTEHGWMSVVLARLVGERNVSLFEPSTEFWPNIRAIWEANDLTAPEYAWQGFVGATNSPEPPVCVSNDWPTCSIGPLVDGMAYRYLHSVKDVLLNQCITIDAWVELTNSTPTAISIDVEGAELDVLTGAQRVLDTIHPLVWVSLHPDLMERDYGTTPEDVREFLGGLGYELRHLGTDHEEHHLAFHPAGRTPK